jgi:hypothetical protein
MRLSWLLALLWACATAAAQQPTAGAKALADLDEFLRTRPPTDAASRPFADVALSRAEAERAARLLSEAHLAHVRRERATEAESRTVVRDGVRMRYTAQTFGKRASGRSLWISLHGGGSVPAKTNDGQWRNQQVLYRPEEGVYVAPRAPTDAWNMWHVPAMDGLFDRLIETLVATEDVDPDRVYLLGYSAGGDGVYQLAPRMADRFAAAAMMAGHPGDASPRALRNLPFSLWMGGKDGAFQRNDHARTWKKSLQELAAADPDGYRHRVDILEDKGHWMDGQDAAVLPWMAGFTRNLRPKTIVWRQDDVVHESFYWLAAEKPRAGADLRAERRGATTTLEGPADFAAAVTVRFDDATANLDEDQRIVVVRDGVRREAFRGRLRRTIGSLARSLAARGDVRALFSAEATVRG